MHIPYGESRMVGVNDKNYRVGEDHQCAKLSDAEVDLIHELRNPTDGAKPLSFGEIARKFEVSKGTVYDIINFRRRATAAVGYRRVKLSVKAPHSRLIERGF
jgi:hypothetical protein